MPYLSISLLGPMQVHLADQLVTTFESNRVRALLAYLAVEATQVHHRQKLAALLWPEWPDATARKNLRSALANLRKAIGDHQANPPFLLITRETIQFNLASHHLLDVATLLQAAERTDSVTIQHAEAAIDLYRGEFLEGFSLADSPPFEEWLLLLRERLKRRISTTLQRLTNHYQQAGDYTLACHYARHQIELDDFQEEAHRQLMQLLATTGETSAAIAHYLQYAKLLATELATQPAPETVKLYTQIKAGTFAATLEKPPQPAIVTSTSQIDTIPLPPFLDLEQQLHTTHNASFVARQAELAQLSVHLDSVLAGQGRIVFVEGDAGSGKTRLLHKFTCIAQEKHPSLLITSGECSAHTGEGDPYLPFRESIGMLTCDIEAKWLAGSLTRNQAMQLWFMLPQAIQHLVRSNSGLIDSFVSGKPLLDRLSGLISTKPSWLEELRICVEETQQRVDKRSLHQSDLFNQATTFFQAIATKRPLLITLDDLHWADPGSLNLLFHLGRCLDGYPILIIGTYRPEEVAAGRNGTRHPLEVVRNEFMRTWGDILVDLNAIDGRHFVDALLDSEPNQLNEQFRDALFQRSMGHALFTTELVHSMRTEGHLTRDQQGQWCATTTLDWHAMPVRVEAVIAERMDRLPAELKKMLTIASVEGEPFTAEVVGHLMGLDDQELVQMFGYELERKYALIKFVGIQRVGKQRLTRYQFRHLLFQKYLHESQSALDRMIQHEAVANTIIEIYGEQRDEMAVQLAHHFRAAGVVDQAISYFEKAGQQAVQLSANQEAETHFNSALMLVPELPDKRVRIQREISLQLKLGVVYGMLHGNASPAAADAYDRSTTLSEKIENAPELFPGLWGLWRIYHAGAQLPKALVLGHRLVELAGNSADPVLMVGAHQALGGTLYFMGKLQPAINHLEQCMALYDAGEHPTYISLYGDDPGVVALAHLSHARLFQGYVEQSKELMTASIELAKQLDHPASIVFALGFTSGLPKRWGDLGQYRTRMEEIIHLCTEHQFPQWQRVTAANLEWLRAMADPEAGIGLMQKRLADWQSTGTFLGQTGLIRDLAKLYDFADQHREGLSLLEQALTIIQETEERSSEAELYQLKGQILWNESRRDCTKDTAKKIEACFLQAIAIAHQQQTNLTELSVTISLSQLYIEQGKLDKARAQLTAIYNWFTEGFDYPEIKQARELLEQLTTMENSAFFTSQKVEHEQK